MALSLFLPWGGLRMNQNAEWWMSQLPHRWRTQQTAKRNAICRTRESSNFWTQVALAGNPASMSVWVSLDVKNTKLSVFNQIYFAVFRVSFVCITGDGSCWVRPCRMFYLSGGVTSNLVHHWRASSQNTELIFNSPTYNYCRWICVSHIFIAAPRWHACMKFWGKIRCGVCAFGGPDEVLSIFFFKVNFSFFFAAFSTHAAKQIFFLDLEFVWLSRNSCFHLVIFGF